MRCKALLLLVALGTPQWLFTMTGCIKLTDEQSAQFNAQMDHDLGGCTRQDTPAGRAYHCKDRGYYLYFYDEDRCKQAVKEWRDRHTT